MSDVWKWRPIREYEEGSFAVLRDGRQQVIGICHGEGWAEMLSGHKVLNRGLQPTHFALVSEELIAEFARG